MYILAFHASLLLNLLLFLSSLSILNVYNILYLEEIILNTLSNFDSKIKNICCFMSHEGGETLQHSGLSPTWQIPTAVYSGVSKLHRPLLGRFSFC